MPPNMNGLRALISTAYVLMTVCGKEVMVRALAYLHHSQSHILATVETKTAQSQTWLQLFTPPAGSQRQVTVRTVFP